MAVYSREDGMRVASRSPVTAGACESHGLLAGVCLYWELLPPRSVDIPSERQINIQLATAQADSQRSPGGLPEAALSSSSKPNAEDLRGLLKPTAIRTEGTQQNGAGAVMQPPRHRFGN